MGGKQQLKPTKLNWVEFWVQVLGQLGAGGTSRNTSRVVWVIFRLEGWVVSTGGQSAAGAKLAELRTCRRWKNFIDCGIAFDFGMDQHKVACRQL